VDQAHKQIADPGAVQRLVEKRVLAVQNRLLQRPFDDVMPTAGLCRVGGFPNPPAVFSTLADAA
jgi:hypothetical protein